MKTNKDNKTVALNYYYKDKKKILKELKSHFKPT